ncbi:MAG: hypothetical protein CMJ42_19250 [Phyllobacteriaceae bacterium]|nr:hypothetical protein [Phyllobacteriaceae bacterium]MBA92071.1 hypothetical protein [Phyllobacteriaceae bacterium]
MRPPLSAPKSAKAQKALAQMDLLRRAHQLNLAGRAFEAERIARQVLDETPSNAEALFLMGLLHFNARLHDEARAWLEKALRKAPADARAHAKLAETLVVLGLGDKALQHMAKAVRLQPGFTPFIAQHASLLADNGRREEALEVLARARAKAPDDPALLVAFGHIHRFTGSEREIAALERLAASPDADPQTRFRAGAALSRALDQSGRHEAALVAMVAARALMPPFDLDELEKRIAARKALFTPAFIADKARLGSDSRRPVFIVGMPRSGTSLVEQIIASHPQAFGAGELPDMGLLVNDAVPEANSFGAQMDVLRHLDAGTAAAMANRYLGRLKAMDAKAARVTDKMPQNFLELGLIAILFPQAVIIHCRRDPADTCISCFLSGLSMQHGYTRDLATLGAYWRAYAGVMDHFGQVLGNRILDVDYETLVADPEPTARALIAHCGLDWDERCLEFWKTERRVSTLSRDQVRQPVHTASVGRWRRYGDGMQPLINALGLANRP